MKQEIMLKEKIWAVVGANENRGKFGNKVFRKLLEAGYTVYPLSHKYEFIEGHKCFKDLKSLPELPGVVVMVVAPEIGESFVKEAAELGIKNVWFQPGTSDGGLIRKIEELELNAVKACVLVALS